VADSGDIDVPYLGPFPAEGKTSRQLALEIKSDLEKKFYYRATVVISVDAMLTKGMVYLVGAVRSPGPLEMPRNDVLTISKAILRAGGFTEFANDEMVRVTRQGPHGTNQVFMMDLHRVLNKGKTEEDKTAQTGDVIYVPEKTIRF
jgi:protein involved in polysaccharide export with SLBB domain